MRRVLVGIASLGVAGLLLTSCGKAPQDEINLANAAINEAQLTGAETYVPESYLALQDSMKSIMADIEAQNSKFFKNYDDSKAGLIAVTQLAAEVKQQTIDRKIALQNEIKQTIVEVKTLLEANKQLILEAPKGKEGATALVAIQGELTAIEAAVTEASALLEQEAYLAGLDKAKASKDKASAINTELQEVITKYKANVKARKG